MIPLCGELLMASFYLQVSVGTLLAFTMVAISVLILRYVPPDEVPLPSSLQESIDSVSLRYGGITQEKNGEVSKVNVGTSKDSAKPLLGEEVVSTEYQLAKYPFLGNCKLPALLTLMFMPVHAHCALYISRHSQNKEHKKWNMVHHLCGYIH